MDRVYILISTNYDEPYSEDNMKVFGNKEDAENALNERTLEIRGRLDPYWDVEGWSYASCDYENVFMINEKREWYSIKIIAEDVY